MLVVQFTGYTYPHKDKLKALGAKWDGQSWRINTDSQDRIEKIKAWCEQASTPDNVIAIDVQDTNDGPIIR